MLKPDFETRSPAAEQIMSVALELFAEHGVDAVTVRQIAEELGIHPKLLYRWRAAQCKHGSDAFPGHGNVSAGEREVVELRRELERTRQERDILKKALSIFAQVE